LSFFLVVVVDLKDIMKNKQKKGQSKFQQLDEKEDIEQENDEDEEAYDLYGDLGLETTATNEQIKKAYFKLAKETHPDQNPDDKNATSKFQKISFSYAILSDPKKRAHYDKTGSVKDSVLSDLSNVNWSDYFNTLFKKVTEEDIVEFEKTYKNSMEEIQDLKKAYITYKGDMEKVLDSIILASDDDYERFKEVLTKAIETKELPKFKAFLKPWKSKKRKKRQEEEEEELREIQEKTQVAKKKKKNVLDSGQTVIMKRDNDLESLTQALMSKYAERNGSSARRSGSVQGKEPTEEEFNQARSRLFGKKK